MPHPAMFIQHTLKILSSVQLDIEIRHLKIAAVGLASKTHRISAMRRSCAGVEIVISNSCSNADIIDSTTSAIYMILLFLSQNVLGREI